MTISLERSVSLTSVTPPPFVFFPTARAHSFWRYFWPFASIRQFILTLALSLMGIIVCAVLAGYVRYPEAFRFGIPAGFVFSILRMIPGNELPAKITVAATRGPARRLMPMLEQLVLERGYARLPLPDNSDVLHVRPQTDAWPGWFYSPNREVELRIVDENIIEIRGPKGALDSIEMFLRWKLEE